MVKPKFCEVIVRAKLLLRGRFFAAGWASYRNCRLPADLSESCAARPSGPRMGNFRVVIQLTEQFFLDDHDQVQVVFRFIRGDGSVP